MKKNKTIIILVLSFLAGLLILLYPSLSDLYNQKSQSKAIVDYENLLVNNNEENNQQIIDEAIKYNNNLKNLKNQLIMYKKLKNYNDILNINNDGMMGYLSINKIRVELPIYHGTDSKVLSKAVGHLEGTSLPVGGTGTHSVLSAHRGLPSSKLFTDLDKLEIGDIFTITILDRVLTYQVDKISTIKPNKTNELLINKKEDYVTLLTCTPYGINTHRLLVRGKRIENINEKSLYITTEAFKISNMIVTPLVSVPLIITIFLITMLMPTKNYNNNMLNEYVYPKKIKNNKNGGKKDE